VQVGGTASPKRGPEPTASVPFDVYPSIISEHNSSLVQPPLVVVAPSSSERGHDQTDDGFTAYSTALSATIAIGGFPRLTYLQLSFVEIALLEKKTFSRLH
jgi:hypothetical protein